MATDEKVGDAVGFLSEIDVFASSVPQLAMVTCIACGLPFCETAPISEPFST